jgi:regulator of sigma E protease
VTIINSIWPLVVTLGVLVFVHELGHFLAAKWAGIRVHRFAIGMGTPIRWLSFRRGDTEYAICWLPLGGYVKMATREEGSISSPLEGESVGEGHLPGEAPVRPDEFFEAKPIWKRMIVIMAGVTMNVLFAWLAYSYISAKAGEQLEPTTTIGGVVTDSLPAGAEALTQLKAGDRIVMINGDTARSWEDIFNGVSTTSGDTVALALADGRTLKLPIHPAALAERLRAALALMPYRPPVLGQILPGKPADKVGLLVGDTIAAVNGDTIVQWYDFVERVRRSAGQVLLVRVHGATGVRELSITPESEEEQLGGGSTRTVGKIGAGPFIAVTRRPYTVRQSFAAGWRATLAASTQIGRTVQGLLSSRISSKEVGGPILIGQMAAQSARLGFDALLQLMALISVNLAVINLMPVPVLDGGQFLFLLAEAVLRRPLSLKLRERLTLLGLILIVMLMVLAFSNDFARNWDSIIGFLRKPFQ